MNEEELESEVEPWRWYDECDGWWELSAKLGYGDGVTRRGITPDELCSKFAALRRIASKFIFVGSEEYGRLEQSAGVWDECGEEILQILDRCERCEWTPSGFFDCPCEDHACPECHHLSHDEDGCGHPDPITGWCECGFDGTDA